MPPRVSFRVFAAVGFTLGLGSLAALVVRLGADRLPMEFAASAMGDAPELKHTWQLIAGKHWQIVGKDIEPTDVTDAFEGNRGACAPGMVEVQGKMKLDLPRKSLYDGNSIEELQKRTCTKWINKEYPERCQTFDRDAWLKISAKLDTKPMHYCMDRFEYPNKKNAYPMIYVSFHEAKDFCKAEGKRLCNEEEWTFACEGEEATPYPYGYERSPETCAIDAKWRPFNETAMQPRDGILARNEMDRLWQGGKSGERALCKSVFGVYDLTGNVDEWTTSVREGERPSILKGGYWGPVRTRCRPSTRSHDENHVFYQQSFRCCSDAPAATAGGGTPKRADLGGAVDEALFAEQLKAAPSASASAPMNPPLPPGAVIPPYAPNKPGAPKPSIKKEWIAP